VKILVDLNISPHVVDLLRAAGFDAVRVGTETLDPRASDEEVLMEAARIGAIVVSRDQDFSALLAMSGATKPSLVNVRVSVLDAHSVATAIIAVIRAANADLDAGAIATIDDGGARILRLPIG
jgi:predicted nuclease of predicted toxin-antitoxin system